MRIVTGQLHRVQIGLAAAIAAIVALSLLLLLTWMTSGDWSPARVHPIHVALVFPVLVAVELGASRAVGLLACFTMYWCLAFGGLVWYIKATGIQSRR